MQWGFPEPFLVLFGDLSPQGLSQTILKTVLTYMQDSSLAPHDKKQETQHKHCHCNNDDDFVRRVFHCAHKTDAAMQAFSAIQTQ